MDVLQQEACKQWSCKGRWKPEVLNNVCGHAGRCDAKLAFQAIERYSSCDGGGSCGWSLNLLKHNNMGMRLWERIVPVLAARPTYVFFLTRRNLAAQALSYKVGDERRRVLSTDLYREEFHPGPWMACNAFVYSKCSPTERSWVDSRAVFNYDLKELKSAIMNAGQNNAIYAKVEEELRGRNHSNITVVHVEYEDLFAPDAWNRIFGALGLRDAQPPSMHDHSSYEGLVSNWDAVQKVSEDMGYSLAL